MSAAFPGFHEILMTGAAVFSEALGPDIRWLPRCPGRKQRYPCKKQGKHD